MYLKSVILLGINGQLGKALVAEIKKDSCVSADFFIEKIYKNNISSIINNAVFTKNAQVIINAIAYTSVEHAENKPDEAVMLNYKVVSELSYIAKQRDLLLVHFSTDYVFDGSGQTPWSEGDTPNPLNIYGQSKYLGEQAIINSGCRYLIIRTSWLHSPWRNNFLKMMLRLGVTQPELRVVSDQFGAPTSAIMLAEMTLLAIKRVLADPSLCGLYHMTASGETSWYEYARFIFHQAHEIGLCTNIPRIIPVTSEHYPSIVKRPLNSRLDCSLFTHVFGKPLPKWQTGVIETLQWLHINPDLIL
ncbi:dTDP-4-dehydrorhamnose reductase [Aeromonas cavernicola]|uniref:dTDP-4-dehydrorhamnose reductase n=1 Tax=Aeromonas cavernicola TaxID=1006623 RepID=A0A2H9U855_9GAMM|nr:dTDP-4-dehydrorhamnose reductase [Aeromonas cavernicola]PJG60159.1 dTDP-4-dehydrorhamnose reductase [Aeromonas cavernicola]